jgi:hypothetical protein
MAAAVAGVGVVLAGPRDPRIGRVRHPTQRAEAPAACPWAIAVPARKKRRFGWFSRTGTGMEIRTAGSLARPLCRPPSLGLKTAQNRSGREPGTFLKGSQVPDGSLIGP